MSNLNISGTNKRPGPHWLRCLPARDRQVVDAEAKWLRPVEWQWFVTLTFPWNVRAETAVRKLRQFINTLEKSVRSNLCMVAGQESRSRSLGMSVRTHFHVLLTSHALISKEAIETIWLGLVTIRAARRSENQDSVHAVAYDPRKPGAEYCLKCMNDDCGDWFMHRLEQFLPSVPGPSKPNHRTVRSAKRANHQAVDARKL